MSTVMAVSPFLLLVAAGLAIMLLDAFVHERAELAFVKAALSLSPRSVVRPSPNA